MNGCLEVSTFEVERQARLDELSPRLRERKLREPGSQAVGRLWPPAGIAAGARHKPTEIVARHEVHLIEAFRAPTIIADCAAQSDRRMTACGQATGRKSSATFGLLEYLRRSLGRRKSNENESGQSVQRHVLQTRFPGIPIKGDIAELRSIPAGTDVVTAGFPCTDLSQAGKTAGITGKDSGLVAHVFRLLADRKTSIGWCSRTSPKHAGAR